MTPAKTPGDRPDRRPREKWSCPHCHSSRGKPSSCTTCTLDMCDECISHDPEVGPVCGLCYDRKHHPEPEENP